ncbi:MAG TPA: hypothetical protein VHC43_14670 [Mycobacteriales bacterium]|nr:hypothetical protein [Mycobacteriales bacterium]
MLDDDSLRAEAVSLGIDPADHCCVRMAVAIARGPKLPDLPVLTWSASWNEYRIGIAGDGSREKGGSIWQRVPASFCPWCGAPLPPSRRDEWYERLHGLGYLDPGNEEIPPEFNSDAWWRSDQ